MKTFRTILIYAGIFLVVLFLLDGFSVFQNNITELHYYQALEEIKQDKLGMLTLQDYSLSGWYEESKLKDVDASKIKDPKNLYPSNPDFTATIPSYDSFTRDLAGIYSEKLDKPTDAITSVDYGFNFLYYPPSGESILAMMLPYLFMIAIALVLFFIIMRSQSGGNNVMNFSKSRPKIQTGGPRVTFADVEGADEEKEELKEVVDFMRSPERFTGVGARIPKGVLLIGPPGTGKTLLAKAAAGESGVPFLSISGSDFVEMFVGVGASRVRDLFTTAKKSAPAVIFIDEIDAVGRHRGAGLGGGHDEREQTLNQILVEMDGFAANEGVIVIAATNRPDILDPALLRPGRFDRRITVNIPDVRGREAILKLYARNKPVDKSVSLSTLARSTPGFTGADLENLLNEAAILTARRKKKAITMNELQEALNRVIIGPEKRSRLITEADKRITAFHEAGHAIIALSLENCDPLREVSIIPRGMAAGYTMTMPQDEYSHMSQRKLLDSIAGALGGRAAEAVALDDICTGAYSDLQHATAIARKMVVEYGMSAKIGPMFLGENAEVFIGPAFAHQRRYSEALASEVDAEIRLMLETQFNRAKEVLTRDLDGLNRTVEALIKHETLSGEQFTAVFKGEAVDFDSTSEIKVLAEDDTADSKEE